MNQISNAPVFSRLQVDLALVVSENGTGVGQGDRTGANLTGAVQIYSININ